MNPGEVSFCYLIFTYLMTKDKKNISRKIIIGFPKARGGGLTSEVQIYFDKGV